MMKWGSKYEPGASEEDALPGFRFHLMQILQNYLSEFENRHVFGAYSSMSSNRGVKNCFNIIQNAMKKNISFVKIIFGSV